MKPDFSAALLKLQRANQHVTDIEARINSYLATDFYRLQLKTEKGTGRTEVLFDSFHQPDKTLSAVIGDAVGNLRSAMDYLANALVFSVTGNREEGGFPFADDAAGTKGTVTKGPLGATGQSVIDLILNETQAYKGGKGHTLWALNKLRNIDKHRLLIATADLAGIIVSYKMQGLVMNDFRFNIPAGQTGTFLSIPNQNIEFTSEPKAAFRVVLKEPPNVPEIDVIIFLRAAVEQIQRLLEALEHLFT